MKRDLYEAITAQILDALNRGTVPWRMPWHRGASGGLPISISTGKPYRGCNAFLLAVASHCRGFESSHWCTFNQAKEMGAAVRKGAKSEMVVFWKLWEVADATADNGKRKVPVLRYFNVFNAAEIDNLPAKYQPQAVPLANHDPIMAAEAIVAGMPNPPQLRHEGGRAFYRPALDTVTMPEMGRFHSGQEYYGTLFHELAHATGHESRLHRLPSKTETGFIGSDGEYAREELVAEMTSAFLCAEAGISPAVIENQAAYLDGWRRKLKADTKAVVIAAAQAQKAADYILARRFDEPTAEATVASESPEEMLPAAALVA